MGPETKLWTIRDPPFLFSRMDVFFFSNIKQLKKKQVTVSCVPFKGLDLKMKRNIRLSNMSGLGLWYQGDRQGL